MLHTNFINQFVEQKVIEAKKALSETSEIKASGYFIFEYHKQTHLKYGTCQLPSVHIFFSNIEQHGSLKQYIQSMYDQVAEKMTEMFNQFKITLVAVIIIDDFPTHGENDYEKDTDSTVGHTNELDSADNNIDHRAITVTIDTADSSGSIFYHYIQHTNSVEFGKIFTSRNFSPANEKTFFPKFY